MNSARHEAADGARTARLRHHPAVKARVICPICEGRRKLWLGGKDYLECPNCDADGRMEVVEQRVDPIARTIFNGTGPSTQVLVPFVKGS